MNKFLKLTGIAVISIFIIAGCQKITPTETKKDDSRKLVLPKTASIFLVSLEDKGKTGKQIGCGDSLVPSEFKLTKQEQEVPIKAAVEHLLAIKTQKIGDLYNAISSSDLKLDKITSDKQNNTGIYLTGKVSLGGTCDTPRFQEQLKATVLQFTKWVSTVQIYINGVEMEKALSQK